MSYLLIKVVIDLHGSLLCSNELWWDMIVLFYLLGGLWESDKSLIQRLNSK